MPLTNLQLSSFNLPAPIVLQNAGTSILSRTTINFVSGVNISDNPNAYRTDVTVVGGGGSVVSVGVATANGFSGTVAGATTTAIATLSTTVTGIVMGLSGALVAATAGTDYQAPINETQYSVLGNNTAATAAPTSIQNVILGVPGFADTGISVQDTNNVTGYAQYIIQNQNSGSAASADYVVSNDIGTASTYYGDFGMNSSKFGGVGPLNIPNAVYVYAQSSDMVVGTNASGTTLHFAVNNTEVASAVATSFNVTNTLTTPRAFVNKDDVGDHLARLEQIVSQLTQTLLDNDLMVPDELTQYLVAS